MFRSIVLVLSIIFVSGAIFAFDEAPGWMGEVARPGYDNLQVEYNATINSTISSGTRTVNKLTNTPRAATFQYESGINPEDAKLLASRFMKNYKEIFQNSADDFRVTSNKLVLNKFYFTNLVQTYNDVDIYGSRLALRVTPEGKVFFAGGEIFTDIELNVQPSLNVESARDIATSGIEYSAETDAVEFVDTYVLPLIYDDHIDYRLCHKFYVTTFDPVINWQVFVDASDGSIVWRKDITRYETVSGNISGMIQPTNPYEDYQSEPFANLYVNIDGEEVVTDSEGYFSYETGGSDPVGIDLLLQGPYMDVNNQEGSDTWYSDEVTPGNTFDLSWTDDNSTIPERNAFYHGQVVHDFIKALDPDLDVMDFEMTCRVNVDGNCNAYYSRWDRSINFYGAGANCPNIAQIADVVYHEWGHGLTNLTYSDGGSEDPNDAMHEAFSDFIACIILDQHLIGNGFYGPGSYLRNLDNDNRYPDDWSGESHNDGLIMGGALWDLREMLNDERPNYIDTLWQYAKYGYAYDFESYFWDVLTVDDDDGDLDNGTPHAYEIFYSFGELHGIGSGIDITLEHTPVIDSEDSTATYPISIEAYSSYDMDEGSVTLYYSTGDDYTTIDLVNSSEYLWNGTIPAQPAGTTVNYYIVAVDNYNLIGYLPEDAPDSVFTFYVGTDYIAPTITEEISQSNTIDLTGPYGEFSFTAWDIHGIDESSGEFHYSINDGSEVTLSMTFDSATEIFVLDELETGEILQVGDMINYYYTCNDLSSQYNAGRLPEDGYLYFQISSSELIGDFEDDLDGWELSEDCWVLFESLGYQSSNCIKTGQNVYPDNANAIAYLSDPIDCSHYNGLWLEFYFKKYAYDGDSCYIVAANDPDGPWQVFDRIGDNAVSWTRKVSNLEGMYGEGNEEVYVGLQFVSDDSEGHVGVLADHFVLHIEYPTAIDDFENLPQMYSLDQNYPNPFNLKTVISFSLAENTKANLEVFDILGRKVRGLVDATLEAGNHQVVWDGLNENGEVVSSGIYFYRLTYGSNTEVKSMTLLK